MNKDEFKKLAESVGQAGKIKRGAMKASRIAIIEPEDVRSIRAQLRRSQSEFALVIGVSVPNLQNWEQHRRKPEGVRRHY